MSCFVCKMPNNDEPLYGAMREHSGIKCHQFCLLFSVSIPQKGKDEQDFEGFLCKDIRKEVQKYEKNICIYCKKPFAATRCYTKGCSKMFHVVCGIENNCLLNFKTVAPFCDQHTGFPKMPPMGFDVMRSCLICIEAMGPYSPLECIQSHCQPRVWMHRECLRHFALQAGYGLKCLICESPDFRNIAKAKGVYVPDRDIQWMLNQCEDRSQDPTKVILICAAKICTFKPKRQFAPGQVVGAMCQACNRPFHKECVKFAGRKDGINFLCFDCDDTELEERDVPTAEEKNQEMVSVPGHENLETKKYVEDVCSERVNFVPEDIMGNFVGPRQAKHSQSRLNLFFNSH